jgi:predicted Abi (CAAX) family protease
MAQTSGVLIPKSKRRWAVQTVANRWGILALFLPVASVAALGSISSCRSRSFESNSFAKIREIPFDSAFVPHSPHSFLVTLMPLQSDQRTPDGQVRAVLDYTPNSFANALAAGQTVKLKWEMPSGWQERVARDVAISNSQKERTLAGKKRDVLPWGLDGWKKVLPLESLAMARAFLPNGTPSFDLPIQIRFDSKTANILEKDAEGLPQLVFRSRPEVVEGSHVGLVRFVSLEKRPEGTFLKGAVFQKVSQRFEESAPFEFLLGPHAPLQTQEADAPALVPDDIVKSKFNAEGWYVHGLWKQTAAGRVFEIRALEPRSLTKISGDPQKDAYFESGKLEQLPAFLKKDHWKEKTDGQALQNESVRKAYFGNENPAQWPVGTQTLFMHVFGWRGKETKTRINTGHFAFGEGTVVASPFVDGEKKWEMVYHQVYGQGPDGVVAATHAWSSYMGSVQRGFVFQVPISDIHIRSDALTQPYSLNYETQKNSFVSRMGENLQTLMAVYRTGDGTGQATIDPVTSCVQDSNFGLYLTYEPLFSAVKKSDADATLSQLLALSEKFKKFQFGLIPTVPQHWKTALDQGNIHLNLSSAERIPNAIISVRTVLPRTAQDGLAKIFAERGMSVYVMRSSQLGGGFALPENTSSSSVSPRKRLYPYAPDASLWDLLFSK